MKNILIERFNLVFVSYKKVRWQFGNAMIVKKVAKKAKYFYIRNNRNFFDHNNFRLQQFDYIL